MANSAILFPGQGAQTVGMAQALCQRLKAAKDLFDQAAGVLGYDLLDVCTNGPAEKLNATDVSQPALYVSSLAALESLKCADAAAIGTCVAAAGLSLGEYTALAFAGTFEFSEGLRLVQIRGRAMQSAAEATPSGMASVIGPSAAEVEELCAEARMQSSQLVQVANYLCPGNTVISGSMAGLEAAEKLAEPKGFRTIRLAVAGAFHTDLMKPADETLAKALAEVPFKVPRVPIWSNVDAKSHTDPFEIKDLLVKQVRAPVRMEETLRGLIANGVNQFYEVGPGKVLAGLLKRIDRKMACTNVPA